MYTASVSFSRCIKRCRAVSHKMICLRNCRVINILSVIRRRICVSFAFPTQLPKKDISRIRYRHVIPGPLSGLVRISRSRVHETGEHSSSAGIWTDDSFSCFLGGAKNFLYGTFYQTDLIEHFFLASKVVFCVKVAERWG